MSQGNKVNYCRNNCGVQIRFDPYHKSQSGKMIPLESETGLPHQCPNSDYNRGLQGKPPMNQQQQQPQQQQTPNFGNLYSNSEISSKEIRSPKQYEDVKDTSELEELMSDNVMTIQSLNETMKDIRTLIASLIHPNPEITKASNIKIDPEIGLSTIGDNDESSTESVDEEQDEVVA